MVVPESTGLVMEKTELVRHRVKNVLHTALLLIAMAGVLALLGWLLAGTAGLVTAAIVGLVSLWFTPRLSSKFVLRLYRARRLEASRAPVLHRIVEALAERADLPETPELYYLPTRLMNAMTVGSRRDPAIGLTDGVLRGLDTDELAGILAHEVAHLANGDTRVMGIADTMARITSLMSTFGKVLLLINLPLLLSGALTVPWTIVVVLLVAPIVSGLLQLALSRTREFDADRNAARLTGDPDALASGLAKLEEYNENIFKQMLLPGSGRRQPSMLRSHPHTEDRIERLRQLSDEEFDSHDSDRPSVRAQEEFDRVRRSPRWRPLGLWH